MSRTTESERRASDVLYDELSASRNSVRRENIRVIKETCDRMEKDGVPMSAAEVVRRCGADGPAYTTVSNTGSKLGEYIKLRMSEQAARIKRVPPSNSLADGVLDPVLQAQIRDKESATRYLQKENSTLRSLLKNLRPGVDIDSAIASSSRTGKQPLFVANTATNPVANEDDVAVALLKLMDHLVGSRQYVVVKGRLTINKKVILDAGDLLAVRNATKLTKAAWDSRYETDVPSS